MKTYPSHRRAAGAFSLLSAAALATAPLPARPAPDVVLWNTLGSDAEVEHSGFGPHGVITRGAVPLAYGPAQFGNGLRSFGSESEGFQTRVAFPFVQPNRLGDRGALAFWVRPAHDSRDRGIRRWINALAGPAPGGAVGLYWRGWDGRIEPFVCGLRTCISAPVPASRFAFGTGQLFHVAMTWDIDGIAGSTDTIRAYVNGVQMGSASDRWEAGLPLGGLSFGISDYAQDATVDNLVVWNGVKTDHADRVVERPLTCDGEPPSLSARITAKAGEASARQWTATLTNTGSCPAPAAQLDGLRLTQTYGLPCTPVRIAPTAFPVVVGAIGPGAAGSGSASFNFSGCAATARFTATLRYSADGGATVGTQTLNNQFR